MRLTRTDLQDIDDLARMDLDDDGTFLLRLRTAQPTTSDAPGLLNHRRAFHLVWRLGLIGASSFVVRTALQENWPENWRTNDAGIRFDDNWFLPLAEHALNEHKLGELPSSHRRQRGASYANGANGLSAPEGNNRTCLIVDDDVLIQKFFSLVVEQAGFIICAMAREGREAIDRAVELEPAVVLMDVHLSDDIDGVEAANEICRKIDTRMILVSGVDDPSTLDRIHEVRPYTVLTKPVSPAELSAALRI